MGRRVRRDNGVTRSLICLGLGYSAAHYVATFGKRFDRVIGTTRSLQLLQVSHAGQKVELITFDGTTASPELIKCVEDSDALLISAPPGETGDPVLACLAGAVARGCARIVYLSTIGVYGDSGGAWVDEESAPKPGSPRSTARLAAEEAWRRFGAENGKAVAILRLAGIYG